MRFSRRVGRTHGSANSVFSLDDCTTTGHDLNTPFVQLTAELTLQAATKPRHIQPGAAPMPVLKARCPECDAGLRLTVGGAGAHEMECPKCGHAFTATLEAEGRPSRKPAKSARRRDEDEDGVERPTQYRQKGAGKSKTPLVVGAVASVLVLVGGIVALALAFSGPDKKPVAQADPPAKANPAPKTNPSPPKEVAPDPKADAVGANSVPPAGVPVGPPVGVPAEPPDELPGPPPVAAPPRPAPADDPFAKAAAFKPDGPLPELPPLPPADRRPQLALDAGAHTAFIRQVYFTPDGDRIISVSQDKSVRAWDVATGEPLYTVNLPTGPDIEGRPYASAMSPDGKLLVVGGSPLGRGKDGFPFYVLSVETGELVGYVNGKTATGGPRALLRSLEFSADGTRVAIGCDKGTLWVYDAPSQKWVYRVLAHDNYVGAIRFSPKVGLLATLGHHQDVKIWDLSNPTGFVAHIQLPKEKPNDLAWTSDGSTLAVGCESGEVLLYDAAGKRLKVVPAALEGGRPIEIHRLRFLPDDKRVVFGGTSAFGRAGVIDVVTGARPVLVRDHPNTVIAVNRSADGARAVTAGGANNEIHIWDTKTGSVVRTFDGASKSLWAIGWAKDGRSLAWGASNAFNVTTWLCPLEQTFRLDDFQFAAAPQASNYARHIRTDGAYSTDLLDFRTVVVAENGKELYRHEADGDKIYSATLVPGKGLVIGSFQRMYLLDTKTGRHVREFRGDGGTTTALAVSPDGRLFASASTDQVVRVWSPDREEPLLSIFSVGREWIAWTPQGYYACSPFGERLVAWVVNDGATKLPLVHPAARFRASLYQPSLIKYLIPAGDLKLAMAMAVKFDKVSIAATDLAEVLPPGVTVAAPPKADDKPVTIRAAAEGTEKNPIVAMRLLVDGRPYDGAAGVKKFDRQVKAATSWQVTLGPGAHTVAVIAESPVSKGMSRPATVMRPGEGERPNLYVLAMGVSDYPGPMKLNFAASDALLLTRTLQEKSRTVFDKIEMRVLTDKDCTKKGMQEGLDWLKTKMTARDVGIVSFSGHGGRDDTTGRFYLIPIDVGRDLDKTCLSGDELKARLEDMPGRLVAVLDACHSGAVTEIKAGRPDNLVRDLTTDEYGVVVLAASLGSEYALESPLTRAGFFTLGLTEGMSGRADFNKDGVIHLSELERYASLRVQQLSRGQQNPTVGRPPHIKSFPIARP